MAKVTKKTISLINPLYEYALNEAQMRFNGNLSSFIAHCISLYRDGFREPIIDNKSEQIDSEVSSAISDIMKNFPAN